MHAECDIEFDKRERRWEKVGLYRVLHMKEEFEKLRNLIICVLCISRYSQYFNADILFKVKDIV